MSEGKRLRISRRRFLQEVGVGTACAVLGGIDLKWAGAPDATATPNLVLVYPDQMRGQAMGFIGQEPVLTPHLDRFARESVVFTHAVSNYPVCSPSRAMLFSGKYPHANGVLSNCNSGSAPFGSELRVEEICWSDVLNAQGYSLGYIGKWHLDSPYKPYVQSSNNAEDFAWNEWTPPSRRHGFDFWYAYGTYDQHLNPMYWSTDAPRDGARFVDEWGPIHEADLAIDFIRNEGGKFRDSRKPFALCVAMNPPHMPYAQVPERYVELYKDVSLRALTRRPNIPPADHEWGDYYRQHIRNYYAMISGVDEQFGRILAALAEAGFEKNTIVVFLSDHGNCLGIHSMISKNNPYEESMRVPLLIRWPGEVWPRRDNLLISVPDIGPTLLDLMGFDSAIPEDAEGTSHASYLRTGKGPRPSSQLYIWTPVGQPAWGRRGVRTLTHTLVITLTPDAPADVVLFDNLRDPYQFKNIATDDRETVRSLRDEELIPWLKKTRDPWLSNLGVGPQ